MKPVFFDVTTKCPHVEIEWVTNASHFDNFDQSAQVRMGSTALSMQRIIL